MIKPPVKGEQDVLFLSSRVRGRLFKVWKIEQEGEGRVIAFDSGVSIKKHN